MGRIESGRAIGCKFVSENIAVLYGRDLYYSIPARARIAEGVDLLSRQREDSPANHSRSFSTVTWIFDANAREPRDCWRVDDANSESARPCNDALTVN